MYCQSLGAGASPGMEMWVDETQSMFPCFFSEVERTTELRNKRKKHLSLNIAESPVMPQGGPESTPAMPQPILIPSPYEKAWM